MSGYSYGESEPRRECPYCGAECHADFVDVGVGFAQCGPYHCGCGAIEIGPFDPPRELTKQEEDYGWYAPGTPVEATSGNVLDGKIVGHVKARKAYRESCGVFTK